MTPLGALAGVAGRRIGASRHVDYQIVNRPGVLAPDGLLRDLLIQQSSRPVLIVVDAEIERRYRSQLSQLREAVPDTAQLVLPGGESNKSLSAALRVVDALDRAGALRRSSSTLVIGGGVVCDVVGFATAIYRRGIPYLRVPTTLLSQVDVSVAAKCGVNHGEYRNRLGAYHPAALTLIDSTFLASLPDEQISNGLGEIVKLGLITASDLFELLESSADLVRRTKFQDDDVAPEVLRLAVKEMAAELEPNLWETNLQRCVDFGHTFSPLIEMRTGLGHGEAVALDCLYSTILAVQRQVADESVLVRLCAVLRACGLPLRHSHFESPRVIESALADTVRHRDGNQHLPVPTSVGQHTFLEDVGPAELAAASRTLGSLGVLPS